MSKSSPYWVAGALAALLGMVGQPETAVASVVGRQDVGLDAVYASTEVAVVVHLDEGDPGGMQHVSVPVPGRTATDCATKDCAAKDCGTYDYGVWTGRILRVVHPPTAAGRPLVEGERIVIFPANTPDLIRLTRRACLDGVRRSPIFRRFPDGAETKGGGDYVALLRWEAPYGWVEAVAGSWLPRKAEKRVARALAGQRRRLPAVPTAADGRPQLEDLLCQSAADCTMGVSSCGPCPPCAGRSARASIHVAAARRLATACDDWRTGRKTKCAPCKAVGPAAPPLPTPVCRDMRCAPLER